MKRENNINVWNTKLTLEYKEALTFIVVETIEEIMNGYIAGATDPLMDLLQFVYRTTSIWNSPTPQPDLLVQTSQHLPPHKDMV